MAKKVINAFNAGEVSPNLYARTDNELYSSACLKMENFIPLEYGGATRRPASRFFSSTTGKSILYTFVFNKDNAYLLSFSNLNLNIYRENADIDNTFSDDDTDTVLVATVTTPFAEASLEKLKFVQANNVLFISSEDYPVQILTRDDNDNFELNELEYKYPPITEEIEDVSISASAISGNTTLTASESIFTQDMVGQTIVLKQHRDQVNSYLSEEVGKDGDSSFSSAINVSFANYEIETSGTGWKGKVVVEKSTDGGKSFEQEYVLIDNSSGSESNDSTISTKHNITSFATPYAEGANTFIRVHFQSLEAGNEDADGNPKSDGVQIKIKVNDIYIKGVFKILSVPTATDTSSTAEGVFISPLQDTEVSYSNQTWVGSKDYKRGAKILFAGVFEQDENYSGSDATLSLPSGAGADGNDVIDMTYDYINDSFYFLTNNDKVIRYDYDKANKTLTYVAKRSLTYGDQYTGTATGRGTIDGQSHFGIAFHSDGTYNEKLFVIMRDERSGGSSSGTRQRAKNSRIRIKYFDVFSTDDDQTTATDLKVFSSRTNRATYNIHGLSYGNNKFYFKTYQSWKTNKYQQMVARYSVTLDGVVDYKNESYQYGKSAKTTSNGTFYTDDYRMMEQKDGDASDIMRRDQMDTVYIDGYLLCLNDADNRLEYRTKSFASTGRKLDLTSGNYFGLAGVPRISTLKDDLMLKGNVYKIVDLGNAVNGSASSNFADWTAVTGITYTDSFQPQVGDTFTAITDGINGVTYNTSDPDGKFELASESIDSASSFDLDIIVMSNTNINTQHNPTGSTELQRYKLSGSSDYYQCIKDHTSTNDFITDVNTGYWAKRYPAVTKAELGAFSPANGYPRSISIFENRLCLGGTKKDPNRLWLSQIDDFNNFLTGSLDTEALDLKFNSLTQDEIEWLVPTTKLIIGTSENEWALDSGSPTQALTPTQINLKKQSQYGSNNQQAVLVNSAVLFLMRQGKKLREWYLQENQQDYLARDLAFVAEHITGDGIKQMAVQIQPTTTIWMVRDDGDLIGLTYERETQTYAWHRHTFNGTVESVAVLPEMNAEDKVYLSVKLDITDNTNTDIAYPTVTETHPNAVTTFTKSSHGFSDGDVVKLTNFNVTSQNYQVTQYDNKVYKVVSATTDTFQLADILNNKIPSPAFNLSAAAFTSSSNNVGNYVLIRGDGTIDDPTTKWVHLNDYLDYAGSGYYSYFDVKDGKWNFGAFTNNSWATATDSTQPKYVWDVATWGDGTTSTNPFNNSNWNGGSATGNVQGNKCTVTDVADDTDLNRRIVCCFDPINWGTDYLTEYNGLDFYKKDDPSLDLDLDLSTVTSAVYTDDGTRGDWNMTINTGGSISILGSQLKIDGSPTEENAQMSLLNVLEDTKTYELTYKVIETTNEPISIKGVAGSIGSSGDGYSAQPNANFFVLKEEVGTHTVRFTPVSGNDDFILIATNTGDGSNQTIELLSFKEYRTEITGLDDLNGQIVSVSVDNVFLDGQYRVSDGKITIDQTSGIVRVGEKYTSTLAPLYLDAQGTQGSKKSIQHAVIRFKDTLNAKVGQKEDALDSVKFGSTTTLNTEDAEVWLQNHNEFLQTVYVVQDEPSPCTVLAMVVDVEGV